MTLPASGLISLDSVNTEVGAASGTPRSLQWVQANTAFAYKDLNSIHGLVWMTAYSSQNSFSRTAGAFSSNCAANCDAQTNTLGMDRNFANCTPGASVNCNQCGYSHGTYLQSNCNCNCNCANCNCNYTQCVRTDCCG